MTLSAASSDRVLVVGSTNADLTVTVERFPGPGETLHASDFAIRPGGKGANQALAAARSGAARPSPSSARSVTTTTGESRGRLRFAAAGRRPRRRPRLGARRAELRASSERAV
ncbi:PfkB family carbohydrate kinase [Yimella sp. cx-51]|uniref:PfkB family carbohydrate kinase n=1 Tax=Yimella sp. cx-51 TaxID=2770551 RepID=UPI00351C72D6